MHRKDGQRLTTEQRSWRTDPSLRQEVVDQFESWVGAYRANPSLISEQANHEESIRVGGYATRSLLELVQNSADAMAGVEERSGGRGGRVEIVLDTRAGALYCANTGRLFSKSGLKAITHAHLSGKRGDEIGRFGLGFKSVLAVSRTPQVFSRSVSFEFNSPAARAAVDTIQPGISRYPILRLATNVDAPEEFAKDRTLAELSEWADTIVKLPHVINAERLRSDMLEFSSEFLLFVPVVRSIKFSIRGETPFDSEHVSRDLGDDVFQIERPDGGGGEWIVLDRTHTPSARAREQVGQAVARKEIKISVAIPLRLGRARGRFWSYFPLKDQTSASGLFNAPWSVNDDRTTLLDNDYNREIALTLSQMFADMLPKVSWTNDPALHLDYMPARGREALSVGDEMLCANVPMMAAQGALVPDTQGFLRRPDELRPLDLALGNVSDRAHRDWSESPNTGNDVPHWSCYRSPQRYERLRQLYANASAPGLVDSDGQAKRAREAMPKRGLLTWLREWSDGTDPASSASALRFVLTHKDLPQVNQARVIPTSAGLRSLSDRDVVFLRPQEDVVIEGAVFVNPDFAAYPGVEDGLKKAGFRPLDPVAVLNARLTQLVGADQDEELARVWDAVLDVPVAEAAKLLTRHPERVKVPTRAGGWAWPIQVLDLDESLGADHQDRMLDRSRCLPEVAHRIGVVRRPVKNFPAEDEPSLQRYRDWVLETINAELGPGERPIENVELFPGAGPGPFSVLLLLLDAQASPAMREKWTSDLLLLAPERDWSCEDLDTGTTHRVPSPARWAVERTGLLRTDRGLRPPTEVVAPSLLRYAKLLPLFKGPRQLLDILDLPDELGQVPAQVLREALSADVFHPSIEDAVLIELIVMAARVAYPGTRPPFIPAHVGKAIEARPPDTVFLATTEEQHVFLSERLRPHLTANSAEASLLSELGCRRFEESFASSTSVEGRQDDERILDVFTGLRGTAVVDLVSSSTLTRALSIVRRTSTPEGAEEESLDWYLDGTRLAVQSDDEERDVLRIVNEAFDLRLTNAELENVLQTGLDHRLEERRIEATAARCDADRLEIYFTDQDLREALPKGLWSALSSQQLVDDESSVGELFRTVYGYDSLRRCADLFRQAGFPDVPTAWAGGTATVQWVRRMGFGAAYAGRREQQQDDEFVVPGAVKLNQLHLFQKEISGKLKSALTEQIDGRHRKTMVELPTGAGKTRVATQTVLELFTADLLSGPVLWIAQSRELCEQAVQTWTTVWRGLGDERSLTVGRLWENNVVHEPETDFSIVVATDAKLDAVLSRSEYEWLRGVSAVFVDEGHRAGDSGRYTRILDWLGVGKSGWARPLVGLSATPFKGTSIRRTDELTRLFGKDKIEAFGADAHIKLADMGVLARVDQCELNGSKFDLDAGEVDKVKQLRRPSQTVLDRVGRDQARMAMLVDHIMSLDPTWPVLVFMPNVLSAQVLAATLRYQEVEAAAVSGSTSRQERHEVLERFKAGDLRVLTNCDLLIQGFDAPGVRALYIARPTFSPNAYIQMAGRGLRGPKNGGKERCLIVNIADNFGDVSSLLSFREFDYLWRESA